MSEGKINRKFIIQIGLLVKDIDAVAKAWADYLGVPVPDVHLNNPYEITQATYNGQPCPARIKQAAFNFDNIELELISPVDNQPSYWYDRLQKDGEGVNHISFFIRDRDGVAHEMAHRNMPAIQTGKFKNGSYTFYDSFNQLKVYLEGLAIDTVPDDEFESTNPTAKKED